MKMIRLVSFILLCLLIRPALHAQSEAGLWTSAEAVYRYNKKLDVSADINFRFNQNISHLNKEFIELSVDHETFSFLKIGFKYRYTRFLYDRYDPFDSPGYNSHRYSLQLSSSNLLDLMKKDGKWELNARLRNQFEWFRYRRNESVVRFRLEVARKIPKTDLKAFVSAESFCGLSKTLIYSESAISGKSTLYRVRMNVGVDWKWKKRQSLTAQVIFQDELQADRQDDLIFSLSYSHRLPSFKKKEAVKE